MAFKCKKVKAGRELTPCDDMDLALSAEFTHLQTLRDRETGKRRQRIALVHKQVNYPLIFCPWCRANIDTTPATGEEGHQA